MRKHLSRPVWDRGGEAKPGVFLTGKLSGEASAFLGGGTQLMSEAVLRRAARYLLNGGAPEGPCAESIAIIDFSASGYCVVTAGRNGRGNIDGVAVNPTCGAGSGINLRRILEKLAITPKMPTASSLPISGARGPVAHGVAGPDRALRRLQRVGYRFRQEQGIPVEHALAVTMKSEVIEAL